ncbi:MAG TPA: glycoside hydrolase family 95 protein [Polyangiaceae bacterium]
MIHRQFWMRAPFWCLSLAWAGCGGSGGGEDAASTLGGTLGTSAGALGGLSGTDGSTSTSGTASTSGAASTSGTASTGASPTTAGSLTTAGSVTGTGGTTGVGASTSSGGGGAGEVDLEIEEGALTLWYDAPAGVWNEALPVGNGRLGAMVFGDPARERLQLNESTFWSGGPSRNDNPQALGALSNVRQLIFDGAYSEAESLINQSMTATQLHGSMFQPIGDLSLEFPGHEGYSAYHRELDLKQAVFRARYEVAGVTYAREVFASQPGQVLVVKLSADQPERLSFTVDLDGPLANATGVLGADTLEMTGRSSSHEGVTGQVEFNARVKVEANGGNTTTTSSGISVTGADDAVILVSIATNFVDYETLSADEAARSAEYLAAADAKSYDDLLAEHVAAYRSYFDRVALDLGDSTSSLPTNQRIAQFSATDDPEFAALYYQFGRYLLISSSQPGGQPANLQGLWNDQTNPPWDSKHTININSEMNYWPAEKCNLSELHEPLLKMVEELSQSGRQTAATMYGADGWVAHHNTDIWRISGVVDGAFWGMWPMGSAWLSQHLWERYVYTGDLEHLEAVYPILKSACEFYQDFLIEEPEHGWLVVSPSISPENVPAGSSTSVCAGATMDNQILYDLFSKTIRAATLLGVDAALMDEFRDILDRLPPMQIGNFGQLQEWLEDWDNPNDTHRHVSHLYGLFPSNQVSPHASPELFDAARTSLVHRGDVSTGWSMGWKVNLWARLLDGDHALKLIKDQLKLVDPVNGGDSGGTYPNLFDAHPPFQIDGNFGCTSGIAEMLLQSHDGSIHVLPALPEDWAGSGGVKGLKAYGGFEVGFTWQAGQVDKLVVRSNLGGNCRLRVPNELVASDGSALQTATGTNPNAFFETPSVKQPIISESAMLNDVVLEPTFLYDLPTEPGQTYVLVATPD